MTKIQIRSVLVLVVALMGAWILVEQVRSQGGTVSGPDAREIPVPAIHTAMKPLPGIKELPKRPDMPAVMLMNDGTKVTTPAQWRKRREEMKRILGYYAVGIAPPHLVT